ncbi:hypothetical protein ACIQZB_42085 [Streptomyces sp. NPDC097727]|uniref:hypothetical protein n=1 Tax=Streptomyces sp. NPDC097727 TaxID=3366092 RepID=UPI00381E48CC
MTSILQAEPIGKVGVGVDTHKYVHPAVAVNVGGGVQGTTSVSADRGGHEQIHTWARQFGQFLAFGVEGAGSYGAAARAGRSAGVLRTGVRAPREGFARSSTPGPGPGVRRQAVTGQQYPL